MDGKPKLKPFVRPTWWYLIKPHPRTTEPFRGTRNHVNVQVGQLWGPNDRRYPNAFLRVLGVKDYVVSAVSNSGLKLRIPMEHFWSTLPTGFMRIS